MPVGQPEDWGIPLWDAIERWTPRELWERYRELADYDIPLFIPDSREDPRSEEARTLHSRLSEILVTRLARGELIASGIAMPLEGTSRRRDIWPELWPRLGFTSRFQEVVGEGLRYDQVLIRETSSARYGAPARRQDVLRPQVSPGRASRPAGRPSIMRMIEAEMRRRATVGLIETSSLREAEALAAWAEEEFVDAHVPKPKSIQKKLGRLYRELKAKKGPINSATNSTIYRSFLSLFPATLIGIETHEHRQCGWASMDRLCSSRAGDWTEIEQARFAVPPLLGAA